MQTRVIVVSCQEEFDDVKKAIKFAAYDYMRKNDMESINIAFPCISTGINAYPNHEACAIAIQTVKRLMNKFPETRAIHVCFVCDKTEDYMLYKEALRLR